MMEKDFNDKELDQLIRDWADELLPQDIDNQITDSLISFVDEDEEGPDVNELLESHIHQLATEESMAKHRKWRSVIPYVAAASVVIFIIAAVFLISRDHTSPTENIFAVENQDEDKPDAIDNGLPIIKADSSQMITTPKATIKEEPKMASNSMPKRNHRGKAIQPKEASTELRLVETFAEINAGLGNMDENALECISMTNEHLNVIENNLINALYEIRSINIDLNFETEYKTTEI